jgi:hypothetical protein
VFQRVMPEFGRQVSKSVPLALESLSVGNVYGTV